MTSITTINEDIIGNLTNTANVPIVFRNYISDWNITNWSLEKWCSIFGEQKIPFRCMKKSFVSDEPCWERKCDIKHMTFKDFIDQVHLSQEWMYFDYKYLHKWFGPETELYKEVSWKKFGYDKGAADSTLWVGNCGSHTPAHQDTYGVNIVAQLCGKKCWILFPPEAGGLRPTRVPYEESSVYSELNFYCPSDLKLFSGVSGARYVELCAGDALFVPRGWWHYVQNAEPVNIALNVWLPHEKDASAQVSEALIKIFVAQICKDMPPDTARLLVNPNEDDICDTPLAVLFLQLETVTQKYLDSKRKLRRTKRQRTREEDPSTIDLEICDFKTHLENPANHLETAKSMTNDELITFLKENIATFCSEIEDDDEVDGLTSNLCLTKAVIDAFSQSNVIETVKHNLFAKLS